MVFAPRGGLRPLRAGPGDARSPFPRSEAGTQSTCRASRRGSPFLRQRPPTRTATAAGLRLRDDSHLILWATEIKVRAERKCGAMLAESARNGERATPADGMKRGANKHLSNGATSVPTLSDIGITRDQSSRYQQLASMSDEHFEAAVATAKDTPPRQARP